MPLTKHNIDMVSGISYTTSISTAAIGTYTLQDLASIAGIVASLVGIVGVIATVSFTWYYKRKYYKLIKQRAEDGKDNTDSWLSR